jgi:hypothetical protein
MPIATLWHVTLRAVQDWWQDNCLRLAASLAYYTALSLAPLVLLIVGVVGLVLDRQQVAQQLTAQLESLMGPAGRELITSILAATSPQGGALATVIGLVTKSAEKPRRSRRGWIGVGRAGLNAQEPNETPVVSKPSRGEGTAWVEAPAFMPGRTSQASFSGRVTLLYNKSCYDGAERRTSCCAEQQ